MLKQKRLKKFKELRNKFSRSRIKEIRKKFYGNKKIEHYFKELEKEEYFLKRRKKG